jgi:hypothetical protein
MTGKVYVLKDRVEWSYILRKYFKGQYKHESEPMEEIKKIQLNQRPLTFKAKAGNIL